MHGFISRLLSSFDQVVLSFPITNDTVNTSLFLHDKFAVVIEEFPLDMIQNDSGAFVFNVASMYSDGGSIDGNAITTREMANDSAATIVIPSSIAMYADAPEFRLTFTLFENELLFLRRSDDKFTNLRVGSPVVSATVNNESITGLQEPVFITLRMDEVQL